MAKANGKWYKILDRARGCTITTVGGISGFDVSPVEIFAIEQSL